MRVVLSSFVVFVGLALVACSSAQETDKDKNAKASLLRSIADADTVFTAVIDRVDPMAQTNSIPPTTTGTVRFKDIKRVTGRPDAATPFTYTHREDMPNMHLDAKGKVLAVAKKDRLLAIVPISD